MTPGIAWVTWRALPVAQSITPAPFMPIHQATLPKAVSSTTPSHRGTHSKIPASGPVLPGSRVAGQASKHSERANGVPLAKVRAIAGEAWLRSLNSNFGNARRTKRMQATVALGRATEPNIIQPQLCVCVPVFSEAR